MSGPFKMKGSPMKRNFGIGSPLHDHKKDADGNVIKHKTKTLKGTTIFGKTIPEKNKAFKENIDKLNKYNPLVIAAEKLGVKKGSLSRLE